MRMLNVFGIAVFCLILICFPASAQEGDAPSAAGEASAGDLAKKSQNPVSDLISVPIENTFGFGAGADGEFSYALTFKPVYPQQINEEWNWVHRLIVPLIDQPNIGPNGLGDEFGLGDVQYQGFLSPANSDKWIFGVGPVLEFPTATDDLLGSEKWSAGVGAVALRMDGPWVWGGLVNNIWSFAGDRDRQHVNRMTIQPFVNYNLSDGWFLNSSPLITANWVADSSDVWTIPIGGGVGKVVKVGKLPVSVSVQTYYNIVAPDNAPDWSVRLQFSLLFPKA
jgi:hypothetical protein